MVLREPHPMVGKRVLTPERKTTEIFSLQFSEVHTNDHTNLMEKKDSKQTGIFDAKGKTSPHGIPTPRLWCSKVHSELRVISKRELSHGKESNSKTFRKRN
jgi:hypothetical protein